jgi:hypothetical protein
MVTATKKSRVKIGSGSGKGGRRTASVAGAADLPETYVSISTFASRFGLSISGVHKLINAGKLAAIEIPTTGDKVQRRIPQSEIAKIEAMRARKKS